MDQWFQWAKEGGAILSPFLLGALVWMNADRNRLITACKDKDDKLSEKDDKLASLSERTLVTLTEIRTFLFNVLNVGRTL
jgi:hypothetical protein